MRARIAVSLLAVAACHAPEPPPPAPAPAHQRLPQEPPAAVAAPPVSHDLAPQPGHVALWPTRVCVAGGALVIENNCGCNDGLICQVVAGDHATLALSLTKDPTRMPRCDDCFPMVPGRCALPLAPAAVRGATWPVTIDGAPVLALPIDTAGGARDGECWTAAR